MLGNITDVVTSNVNIRKIRFTDSNGGKWGVRLWSVYENDTNTNFIVYYSVDDETS